MVLKMAVTWVQLSTVMLMVSVSVFELVTEMALRMVPM
jgi:hypothetical protein